MSKESTDWGHVDKVFVDGDTFDFDDLEIRDIAGGVELEFPGGPIMVLHGLEAATVDDWLLFV